MRSLKDFIINNQTVYIMGTSTDVGKTYVGTSLYKMVLEEIPNFHVFKAIETGSGSSPIGPDTEKYLSINEGLKKEDINLYTVSTPCSPHLSEELENIEIDFNHLLNFIKKKKETIIELAGGLMVPVNKSKTQFDLFKAYPNAVVIVAHAGLGTLNHVLLTTDKLQTVDKKIPIHLVLNFYEPDNLIHIKNKEYLEQRFPLITIAKNK